MATSLRDEARAIVSPHKFGGSRRAALAEDYDAWNDYEDEQV